MKKYFNLNDNTFNNYCDEIVSSYMVEIPDNGKPYGIIDGEVVDISQTPDYITEEAIKQKILLNTNLLKQINELDIKRIRALVEAEIKDEATGETWLEFYTKQILELRAQIAQL